MTLSVVLLALLCLGIVWFEAPRLVREKKWRELIVFSIFLVLGFVLSLGNILELPLPNPSRIIAKILHIKY